uniref:Uncharacterized protein n=1 Tax=Bodo saltans TaxID=75058 RepID=B6DT92_BODSA|nr:hypothetical protein [Bodo saltans]
MRTTLSDVTSIVSSVMEDADTAESIAKLISAATSRLPSKAAPSTRDVLFAVGGVEVARKEMEKSLDERIFRCSSVIQFLRRVELAIGGKSIIPAAEQQFEIREETSNRALTGSIQFFNVPPKSVRLIAQFTINYDEGKLQDISGPSVFFGTTREDVVSIPAVNGGTCRARLDAKAGGLLITTGVLDFQLSPVRYQPLILEGTVTDPAASHAVVGKVLLQQVVEEGENVYNKNWLRFGPTNTNKPTSAHNDSDEDDPSFYQNNNNNNSHANKHDMYALSHPESVPGEEDLQMNRIDTDRYVSRVGSMCKTLQTQLEQLVLQKVFQAGSSLGTFAPRSKAPPPTIHRQVCRHAGSGKSWPAHRVSASANSDLWEGLRSGTKPATR